MKRLLALALVGGSGVLLAAGPAEIDGLVAWYKVDSLHRDHNEGENVSRWRDSSERGHHLVADSPQGRALFRTMQVNQEPAIQIRRGTEYAVTRPFELDDHTIFLVHRTDQPRRAFLHGATDPSGGLLLHADGRFHRIQRGAPDVMANYNAVPISGEGFSITMLTRRGGVLGCFINGVDLSSQSQYFDALGVGRLFSLRRPDGLRSGGEGLMVAEMIFYDRVLDPRDSGAVTAYLSKKYAIEAEVTPPPERSEEAEAPFLPQIEDARVWLTTTSHAEVNEGALVIPWDVPIKLEPPFAHDPAEESGRLTCTADATSVELFVQVPVKSAERNSRVRLLILKNGDEYLEDEGDSGLMRGRFVAPKIVRLGTRVILNAGDQIEVVITGAGEPGRIRIEPEQAVFAVRVD